MAGPFQCPQLGWGHWKMGRVARKDETYIHKKMQTHHAGFLLLCVCVMLISDIHLLSVPHAGPLTRTHNTVFRFDTPNSSLS
jgi:hypothetical protein